MIAVPELMSLGTKSSTNQGCQWTPKTSKGRHRMLPPTQAMMGPGSRTPRGLPGFRMSQPSVMQRTPSNPNKLQMLHQKLGQQAPDVKADAEQLLKELMAEALQVKHISLQASCLALCEAQPFHMWPQLIAVAVCNRAGSAGG